MASIPTPATVSDASGRRTTSDSVLGTFRPFGGALGDASQAVVPIARVGPGGAQPLGTAFTVGGSFLATPFHVATADDSNLVVVMPRIVSLDEYQDTSDTSLKWAPVKMVAADPVRDICILSMPGIKGSALPLGSSDDAPVGLPTALYGFPHAASGRLVLTQQQSTVGARILIESSGQKIKHLVLNVQARDGQSGSPVVSAKSGKVVAMVLGSYAPGGGGLISIGGVDPATLHQTTHAVSAEYIRDMIPR